MKWSFLAGTALVVLSATALAAPPKYEPPPLTYSIVAVRLTGGGTDTLNLDDTADVAGNTGRLTATTLTGLGMTSGISYAIPSRFVAELLEDGLRK